MTAIAMSAVSAASCAWTAGRAATRAGSVIAAMVACWAGAEAIAPAQALAVQPGCAQLGQRMTCTFLSGTIGLSLPAGASAVHVTAVGGAGAAGTGGAPGGHGARVDADLQLGLPTTIFATVGANATALADGGEASDVRSVPNDLASRLAVAGAGGGGGLEALDVVGNPGVAPGGAGGDAGAPGQAGAAYFLPGGGGAAGTPAAGGAGGAGGGPGDMFTSAGPAGSAGTAGAGGPSAGTGGYGGDGLFGGGGGGAGATYFSARGAAGGGGGGSSLVPAGGAVSVDYTGSPLVAISYTLPPGAAPGPSLGPVAAFAGSPKSIRVSSSGRFGLRFVATPSSSGTVKLASTKKVRVGSKKRKLRLAAKSFSAPSDTRVKVRFKLSRQSLKALKRVKSLRFKVTVTLGGHRFTTQLKLKAPK